MSQENGNGNELDYHALVTDLELPVARELSSKMEQTKKETGRVEPVESTPPQLEQARAAVAAVGANQTGPVAPEDKLEAPPIPMEDEGFETVLRFNKLEKDRKGAEAYIADPNIGSGNRDRAKKDLKKDTLPKVRRAKRAMDLIEQALRQPENRDLITARIESLREEFEVITDIIYRLESGNIRSVTRKSALNALTRGLPNEAQAVLDLFDDPKKYARYQKYIGRHHHFGTEGGPPSLEHEAKLMKYRIDWLKSLLEEPPAKPPGRLKRLVRWLKGG